MIYYACNVKRVLFYARLRIRRTGGVSMTTTAATIEKYHVVRKDK